MDKEYWFLHNLGIHILNIPRKIVNAWRKTLFWFKRLIRTGSIFGEYSGRRRVTMEAMKLIQKIVTLAGGILSDEQVVKLQNAVNHLPHVNITEEEIRSCFAVQPKTKSHASQKAP
ncbi:hypothetical protein KKA15_07125 [Patescibacteria group bacterium]|nr:hypothetical protein [Patescibacteria group bacterium]